MNRKRVFIFSGALLCFAFVAFNVIYSMTIGENLEFDTIIRNVIIGYRNDILNPIFIFITYLANFETIIFICVILFFFKKTRVQYGVPLAITASGSATIQTIIKILVERSRPPVENFIIIQGGYSFPSGHSCSGLVFYGLLIYLFIHTIVDKTVNKIFSSIFITLILLIGISRIYVGVHYPTDVIAGWLLGLAILMIAITVIDKCKGKRTILYKVKD